MREEGGCYKRFKKMNKKVRIQYFKRNQKLNSLGYKDYRDYLSSEDWRKIKEKWEKKKLSNFPHWGRCRICHDTNGLVLHHLKYGKVEKISFTHFMPACRRCHEEIHRIAHSDTFSGSIKHATRKWAKEFLGKGVKVSRNIIKITK